MHAVIHAVGGCNVCMHASLNIYMLMTTYIIDVIRCYYSMLTSSSSMSSASTFSASNLC